MWAVLLPVLAVMLIKSACSVNPAINCIKETALLHVLKKHILFKYNALTV